MERNVTMEEISDGKLYGLNDMVKAGCSDCKGCSDCCRGMGNSIVLDPLDCYRLTGGLGKTFEVLLSEKRIELNVVESIILPNLKMSEYKTSDMDKPAGNDMTVKAARRGEACSFLNSEGRCSIHEFRPGICRLFPLGRFYENGTFSYFLQIHECSNRNRTKVKVKSWIDTPDTGRYEKFICDWHYFLKDITEFLRHNEEAGLLQKVNMYLLNQFFVKGYDHNIDFYEQFYVRLDEAAKMLQS